MNNLYDVNVEALRRCDPRLAERLEEVRPNFQIIPSLSQGLNLRGLDLRGCEILVVLGPLLQLNPGEFLRRTKKECFILSIDDNISNFKATLFLNDLRPLLRSRRVGFEVEENPVRATRIRLDREFGMVGFERIDLIEHPVVLRLNPQYYKAVKDVLANVVDVARLNVSTIAHFEKIWRTNIIKNIPSIVRARKVRDLFGMFKGVPAFIVSAGPSLDRNVSRLQDVKGRGLVICVDTALRTLITHSVRPDFVVSLDGGSDTLQHFTGLDLRGLSLIFPHFANPEVVALFQDLFLTDCGHPFSNFLKASLGEAGEIKVGGSVSSSCLDLAKKFGCDPIILIGQDFSYPAGLTYTRGSSHYDEYLSGLNKFQTIEMIIRERIKSQKAFEVEGVRGDSVLTTPKLYHYLKWFESQLLDGDHTYINATETGARIKGTKEMTLDDAVKTYCRIRLDIPGLLESIRDWSSSTRQRSTTALRVSLRRLLEESVRVRDIAITGLEKVRFREGRGIAKELKRLYFEVFRYKAFFDAFNWGIKSLIRRMRQARVSERYWFEKFFSELLEMCGDLDVLKKPHFPLKF